MAGYRRNEAVSTERIYKLVVHDTAFAAVLQLNVYQFCIGIDLQDSRIGHEEDVVLQIPLLTFHGKSVVSEVRNDALGQHRSVVRQICLLSHDGDHRLTVALPDGFSRTLGSRTSADYNKFLICISSESNFLFCVRYEVLSPHTAYRTYVRSFFEGRTAYQTFDHCHISFLLSQRADRPRSCLQISRSTSILQ